MKKIKKWRNDSRLTAKRPSSKMSTVRCSKDVIKTVGLRTLIVLHVISSDGKAFMPSVLTKGGGYANGYPHVGTGEVSYGHAIAEGEAIIDQLEAHAEAEREKERLLSRYSFWRD